MHYIRVDKAPEKLKDNEMVVEKPDFMEEVKATRKRRGVNKIVTITSLRDTLMVITDKYDNTINPYHLVLIRYNNLVYDGDIGFSKIIQRVIKDLDLSLVEKAIEFKLLKRNPKVDTIFYVSDDIDGSEAFVKLGFHMKEGKKIKTTVKKEDVV